MDIILVSEGCHNKVKQTRYLKTTEIYSFPDVEARSLQSKGLTLPCSPWSFESGPHLAPDGCQEYLVLPGLLMYHSASIVTWLPPLCLYVIFSSQCKSASLSRFLLLIRTLVTVLGPDRITSTEASYSQIRPHSQL